MYMLLKQAADSYETVACFSTTTCCIGYTINKQHYRYYINYY